MIESFDWVNVVPVTSANQIVMVEQYRHGSGTIELEVPGGMMDPQDGSPIETAMRELREETGYEGRDPEVLGEVYPNPAMMNNVCRTILIRDCMKTRELDLDPTEDLCTRLVPVGEARAFIQSGRIKHSLVAAALYHFEIWRASHGCAGGGLRKGSGSTPRAN